MKRLIPLLICFVLILSGCQNDGNQTVAEGAGAGAVVGALLGGVVAVATGDAAWVAIGAGAGAVVGLGAGVYVANKKESYATKEAWLEACIKEAQTSNEAITAYNTKLKDDLTELDAQSKQLAFAYKSQAAKANELQAMHKAIVDKQNANDKYIADIEKSIAKQKGVVAEAKQEDAAREAAIIEHEIKKMEAQVADLRDESSKLADMSTRVAI